MEPMEPRMIGSILGDTLAVLINQLNNPYVTTSNHIYSPGGPQPINMYQVTLTRTPTLVQIITYVPNLTLALTLTLTLFYS